MPALRISRFSASFSELHCRELSFGAVDGGKEGAQFLRIQRSGRAHARTQVKSERSDCVHGLRDIACIQAAGEEDRDVYPLADLPAKTPVMTPARASKFFDCERGIAGVQQNGVHKRGYGNRLIDGLRSGNVNDLRDFDARQGGSQVGMGSRGEAITKLKAVGPAAALLRNNLFYVLLAGEQKSGDGRRYRGGNLRNLLFSDHARAAGHRRNQAKRRRATLNCQRSFFDGTDAADFDSGRVSGTHHAPSFAVRDPDIFDLGGMLQEPAPFALLRVEPVNLATFVGEDLLQISD